MSYLGVKLIQIAASVSLVIRHLLHKQQESIDSFIVNEKQNNLPTHSLSLKR